MLEDLSHRSCPESASHWIRWTSLRFCTAVDIPEDSVGRKSFCDGERVCVHQKLAMFFFCLGFIYTCRKGVSLDTVNVSEAPFWLGFWADTWRIILGLVCFSVIAVAVTSLRPCIFVHVVIGWCTLKRCLIGYGERLPLVLLHWTEGDLGKLSWKGASLGTVNVLRVGRRSRSTFKSSQPKQAAPTN